MNIVLYLAVGFGLSIFTWVGSIIAAIIILPERIAEQGRHGKSFAQLAVAYIIVSIIAGFSLAACVLYK